MDDIKTSMDYEIVVRYEPTMPINWDEVEVTVIRPEPVDPNGFCRDERDDIIRVGLPANSRTVTVTPSVCLEAGRSYKVRLSFHRSNYETDSPSASVLIDSVIFSSTIVLALCCYIIYFI